MATNNLVVTPPPHLRAKGDISTNMRDVLIALIPAAIAALVVFKVNALINLAICATAAVAFDWVIRKLMKKEPTVIDFSALLTGVLVALVMPPLTPWFTLVIAVFIAVVIVKELTGGLGRNIFNPALFGFVFVLLCSGIIASWTHYLGVIPGYFDGATGGTPLALLKHGTFADLPHPSYLALLFGNDSGGALVEVGAFWVLLGGAYLLYKGTIRWIIPTTIIATVLVLSYVLGKDGIYAILAGGVMLGAFFMATDWVTSPMTAYGQIVFGLLIGICIVLIRTYGGPTGAVAFSILIGNAFVPVLDKLFKPARFGAVAAS
jgi:Na+-translocating ferredoxin:NAD+ oxidoreductase subunit D